MSNYVPAILAVSLIYGLLGLGLNLQWGHTGLLNFGHVAFFAAGAYTSALVTLAGAPVVVGILSGVVAAGLLAYPIGWLTVRLKADYLAIVTIALSESLRILILNASWSGGPSGLTGVPRLFVEFGRSARPWIWSAVLTVVVVGTVALLRRVTELPFGRALRAIRSDEIAVTSLGKDVAHFKTVSLVLGSGLAGLAGALYAHWIGYIVPDQFVPLVTFYVWVGIIMGGSSHWGAAVGTGILIGLFELTRFLGDLNALPIGSTDLAQIRFILVGLALILLLQHRPRGLWPYRPRHWAALEAAPPASGRLAEAKQVTNADG